MYAYRGTGAPRGCAESGVQTWLQPNGGFYEVRCCAAANNGGPGVAGVAHPCVRIMGAAIMETLG